MNLLPNIEELIFKFDESPKIENSEYLIAKIRAYTNLSDDVIEIILSTFLLEMKKIILRGDELKINKLGFLKNFERKKKK